MALLDGRKVRELRDEKGFTQEGLADAVDVDVKTLRQWELGLANPRISNLHGLARALGVDPTDLLATAPVQTHREYAAALPAPPSLVGREREIDAVLDLLKQSTAQVVVVHGPRGVGKTGLAVCVSHRARDQRIFERVVWVTAKGEELAPRGIVPTNRSLWSLQSILHAIAAEFQKPDIGAEPIEHQEDLVIALLSGCASLLAIDNVDALDESQLNDIIRFLSRLPARVKVLVTGLSPLGLPSEASFYVHPLRREDACALIEREAISRQITITVKEQQKVFADVGGVPILLLWFVGIMSLGNLAVAGVQNRLRNCGEDVNRWIFGASWDALSSDTCRRLLIAASVYRSSFTRDTLGYAANVAEDVERDAALAQLSHKVALLQYDPTTDRFAMLPLTRSCVLGQIGSSDSRNAWRRAAEGYGERVREASAGPNVNRGILYADTENILGIAEWCCANNEWDTLARLLCDVNQLLYTEFRWTEFRYFSSAALEHVSLIGDRRLVANLQRDLAWVYIDLHEHRTARKLARDALGFFTSNEDYHMQATCLRYLAQIACREHRFALARRHIAASRQAALKACSPDLLLAMLDNLDATVCELEGDYDGAVRCYETSLRRRRHHQPPDEWGTCAVLRNLGALFLARGEFRRATRRLLQCLVLCQKISRQDLEAGTKLLLARLRAAQGRRTEARQLAEGAQGIFSALGMRKEQDETRRLLKALGDRKHQ